MGLRENVRADIQLAQDGPYPLTPLRLVFTALFANHLQSVLIMRLGMWAHGKNRYLGSVLKYINHVINGCDISSAAKVGPGLRFHHPSGIVIGRAVVIGSGCTVMQGVTLGTNGIGSPVVGNNVFLGPGSRIVGNITIGDGSYIGANAVVTKDIPAHEMWVGVPARFHRALDPAIIPTEEMSEL
jgi:serine O-acetyltransferase